MSRSDNVSYQMPTVMCIIAPLKEAITSYMLYRNMPNGIQRGFKGSWAYQIACSIILQLIVISLYEGCSNMNASSFITFFTYMLRQNGIPFWKELSVAFKIAPNIKKRALYFSSYRPLYKGHSCILTFFSNKLQCTIWYMCGYSVISL